MESRNQDLPKIDTAQIKNTAREILVWLCSNPMVTQLGAFETDPTAAVVSLVSVAYQLATGFEMAVAKADYKEQPIVTNFWMSHITENEADIDDD